MFVVQRPGQAYPTNAERASSSSFLYFDQVYESSVGNGWYPTEMDLGFQT